MKDNIFSSLFKLNFLRKDIEIDYRKQKEKKIIYYNEYMIIFSFVCCIVDIIIDCLYLEYFNSINFHTVLFSASVLIVFYFVLVCISLFSRNLKVLKWIHYINYYLLVYIFINFRYKFARILKTNCMFIYFIIIVEMVLRLVWNILGLQSFLESFILNIITIVSMWIVYIPTFSPEQFLSGILNFIAYSITLIFVMGFAYVLEKQQKCAFYFHWILDKKAIWLTNVLETMNAGFLSINGNKVVYINSFLMNQIKKIKKCDKCQETCKNKNVNENEAAVQKLISEFKVEINSQPSEADCVKMFTNYISQIPEINNFKLIGDIVVELEDSELSLEIQCRYKKSETEEDELEFLLNDVTRTKTKEKEIAEIKYKTVFLSKVAHEFKNPLICITELINKINDEMERQKPNINNNENNINLKAFNKIKSLSNFLLILVKDLNYFSESQIGKNISMERKENDLEEVVEFCKLITESLIEKNNKSQVLKFLIIIDENVPLTIMTDQWRLKQVLINLLSNSVKFTLFGKITLEISLEKINFKEMIKFLVKDTGVGMKEEQQKKLFIPFSKGFNNYNNEMGSGLGLNIANDIAKQLGMENIQFHSEYDKGSSFWFYVDNSSPEEKPTEINNNQINKIELIDNYPKNIQKAILDESREIIPNDLISIFSNQTENNEFAPSQFFPTAECIIKERTIGLEDNSSDIIKEKSQSINFKYKIPKIKNTSNSSMPFKDDTQNTFSVIDFLSNDLTFLRKVENVEVNKFISNKIFNVIVVDDEVLTRQSTIRILNNVSQELGIKINLIEAEDGVESVYLVYKAFTKGIKISLIFSDETMQFMNGSRSSEIINEILQRKNLNEIPFYLVTAFDNNLIENYVSPTIKKILTKPLSKDTAKKLIYEKANT